jgi:methionyl aminopeptidase
MPIIYKSRREIELMRRAGQVACQILAKMREAAVPGMTTFELDELARVEMESAGAISGSRFYPSYKPGEGYPGYTCISVNDEVVHGIPGGRVLRPGDAVKLDVTADRDGYVADAARTVVLGPATPDASRLAAAARAAFQRALDFATAGRRIRELGRAVDTEARRHGARVIRELCGHGVGRKIHEPPSIPNYYEPRCLARFTEGLVVTVEPILCAGSGQAHQTDDGWTVRTSDGSLAAHHEETLVITRGRPLILTAA